MAVSRLLPSGGANDFNLNITGATTSVIFDKEYAGGSYSITSSAVDTTIDIYAYNSAGTLVGYTSTKAFTASGGFNKIVVLGGTVGDVLGFTYKKTFTTAAATAEVTAGPVIISSSPSAAPKIEDTITITGANFASNVTITFSSTTGVYTSTAAKSIVRTNSTSLIVTRPDNLPVGNSPYTITVSNPGVSDPVGTSAHILPNSVTAGVSPVWVTGALISYTTGTATSITLSATDADAGSDIDYSIVSGTLPTGLSLDGETGVISGTPSNSQQTVTFRATDQGGNFVDKAILFNANPVWSTAAGALPSGFIGSAYSTTVVATDDVGVTYSVASGSLPTGLSINSSTGVISGTPSAGGSSFTINATDASGVAVGRAFSIAVPVLTAFVFGTPPSGSSGWGYGGPEDCTTFTFNTNVLFHGSTGANGSPNGQLRVYSGGTNASAGLITTTSNVVTDPVYGGRKFFFSSPLSLAAGTYTLGYYQTSGGSGSGSKSNSPISIGGTTVTPSDTTFSGGFSSNGTSATNGSSHHVIWLYA